MQNFYNTIFIDYILDFKMNYKHPSKIQSKPLPVRRRSISLMCYSELPTSARAVGCTFCVDADATSRSTVESKQNRLSGLSRRCREGLSLSTAVNHVVAVIAPGQKGAEDGIVPTFERRRTSDEARHWSLIST